MQLSEIGNGTETSIVIRGKDFPSELLGKIDFLDMIMLTSAGRVPSESEKVMLNLILVTAAGHGITPSVLSARLTYLGAPEALQGAVAAGLLGGGSAYLGPIQNIAGFLIDLCKDLSEDASEATVADVAGAYVDEMGMQGKPVLGVGSGAHAAGDPRVPVMRAVSEANGYYGRHWRVMDALATQLGHRKGKPFAVNGAGALGAIVADMNLDPLLGRGLMLTGRCASLVAHILEEQSAPMGKDVWNLVLREEGKGATA